MLLDELNELEVNSFSIQCIYLHCAVRLIYGLCLNVFVHR